MHHQILIVEDDPDQLQNYSDALCSSHYQVRAFDSDQQVREQLDAEPDIALLDIHLGSNPDAGFELCQWLLGRYPDLPVLFITSRSDEIDQIFGLRLGAWDYLTKPVSLMLLREKVAAILKRARKLSEVVSDRSAGQDELESELALDISGARAMWRGLPLNLTVTELLIVEALVNAEGAVVSFDALAQKTRQTVVTNNTLSTHIRHLRNKFKAVDPDFDRLVSVYGLGYRWQESEGGS
ncbi:response regulator [Motiliproteus coralliicola]|uniref:Response regulator n=1 Tax=Motiliproteus coralliicola TaxID=2283196 RepID=A0A369WW28_9GAMM|nr:response regulator transcription factor [Motiliproteus coralliicola]RDE25239.1 response regulator [Motiliproteus coralliicola]